MNMMTNALPMNPKGINGSKGQRSAPGTFATGKGTTALIKEFFDDRFGGYTAAAIGCTIGKQPRQIGKRLAEQVKAGYLTKDGKRFFRVLGSI